MVVGSLPGREELLRNLTRNLALEATLAEIGEAFARRGIQLGVLKGVPLMRRLKIDLGARWIMDNDLLVRRSDAPRAYDALLELGFDPPPRLRFGSQLRRHHELALRRCSASQGQTVAELHWAAFAPQLFRLPEARVWQHMRPLGLRGVKLWEPDDTLTILILAAHFVQHELAVPRILEELGRAWSELGPRLEPRAVWQLADSAGLAHALSYCIEAARVLGLCAGPRLPSTARARALLRSVPPEVLFRPGQTQSPGRVWAALWLVSPTRLPAWVWSHVAPPLDSLAAIYDEPESLALLPRYVTRWGRPLARRLGVRIAEPRIF